MFGLPAKSKSGREGEPSRKRTDVMSNSRWIANEFETKCHRLPKHIPLARGREAQAAGYKIGSVPSSSEDASFRKKKRASGNKAVMKVGPVGKGPSLPDMEEHQDAK